MLNSLLFALLTVFRVVIAVLLTRTGLRKETRPVLWLAGLFYLNIIFSLSGAGLPISQPLVVIFQGSAQICLVMFIATTFYNHRSSPMPIFMGFTVLTIAGALALALTGGVLVISTSISTLMVLSISQVLNWGWHGFAAWQALKDMEKDKFVEDWVRSRYKLMIAYCLVFIIPVALVAFQSILPAWLLLFIFALGIGVLVVQYLVWGMPEGFRKYLNRNYKPALGGMDKGLSMSEEEIMGMLQK